MNFRNPYGAPFVSLSGSSCVRHKRRGVVWQAQVNGALVAHADLEKAKAKADWLIWNELRVSADAYRRIRERVKAPCQYRENYIRQY